MENDFFSPETVDEQVEQVEQAAQANNAMNKAMIQQLRQVYHAQNQDAVQDLEQVWNQIATDSVQTSHQKQHSRRHVENAYIGNILQEGNTTYVFPNRKRKTFMQQVGVIMLVACVILLLGSTFIVFRIAGENNRTVVGQRTTGSPTVMPSHTAISTQTGIGSTVYTYNDTAYSSAASDNGINSVSWSPDGKRIASTSTTVQVWDATTGKHLLVHKPLEVANLFVSRWSPDGKRIATSVPFAETWNATTGKTLASCNYGNQQAMIATGRSTSTASISQGYQVPQMQLLSSQMLLNPLSAGPLPGMLAWSPDGRYIAIPYQNTINPMIVVWDASTCKLVTTFQGQSDISFDVEWSPDGKYIASASADKTVRVWDVATHQPLYIYHDPAGQAIYRLAWSPNGKRIASIDAAGSTVDVWDAFTGGHTIIYSNHSHNITTIAWSPDGKRIASGGSYTQTDGSLMGEVQLWNPDTGEHLFTYRDNPNPVLTVAWSPDGTLIASADGFSPANSSGGQSTVKVWRTK